MHPKGWATLEETENMVASFLLADGLKFTASRGSAGRCTWSTSLSSCQTGAASRLRCRRTAGTSIKHHFYAALWCALTLRQAAPSAAASHAERPTQAVVPSSGDKSGDCGLDRSSAFQRSAPIMAQSSSSLTVATVAFTLDRGLAGPSPGATGLWLSSGHPTSAVLPLGRAGRTAPCSGQWHGA